ncbi:hypothetical protein BJX64DRAFT_247556 [Aspergillus heterothallicus]
MESSGCSSNPSTRFSRMNMSPPAGGETCGRLGCTSNFIFLINGLWLSILIILTLC